MGKRAWQYPEATGITNDDVILLDSPTGGSRSIKANKIGSVLINKTLTERGTFDAADDNVDGYKKVTVDVPYTDVEVASGPVASWDDGEDLPLKSLTCFIEPQQDLHGYDSPWVGGAGKNKLPMTVESIKSKNTAGTWNNNVYTKNDMSFEILTDGANNVTGIKVNGTKNVSSPVYFTIGSFDFAANESYKVNGGVDLPSPIPVYFAVNGGVAVVSSADYTQTFTSDTTKDVIIVVERTQQISNVIFHPMIRLSTEQDSSYAPYSNICPISGWDECNVTDCGKNLWGGEKLADDIVAKVPNATKNTTNKTVTYAASNIRSVMLFDKFKTNTRYSFFLSTESSFTNIAVTYTDETQDVIIPNQIFVSNANKTVARLSGIWPSGSTVLKYDECGIFEGVLTAQDFEPYNGQTYKVEFKDGDNPLTVYGGTLDVVSGELVVDRVNLLLNGLTYTMLSRVSSIGGSYFRATIPQKAISDTDNTQLYSHGVSNNPYASKTNCARAFESSAYIFVGFEDEMGIDTLEKFNQWLVDNQTASICYKIKEPQTYQLTPTAVKSLDGDNNVSASTGQIEGLEYFEEI